MNIAFVVRVCYGIRGAKQAYGALQDRVCQRYGSQVPYAATFSLHAIRYSRSLCPYDPAMGRPILIQRSATRYPVLTQHMPLRVR